MTMQTFRRMWLGGCAVAAAVIIASHYRSDATAIADQGEPEGRIVEISPNNAPLKVEKEEADEAPAFWIGIQGGPINSALLRTHLQLADNMGVAVEQVVPKSPAEKAGLRKHDIVIAVDGQTLNGGMELLQKAVANSEGKPIELKVIRLAKEETVAVTPEERPADLAQLGVGGLENGGLGAGMLGGGDLNQLLEQLQGQLPQGNRMRIVGPAAILEGQAFNLDAMPGGVSISITREGDGPAKITVKRGDESWTVEGNDEKALAKLPDDVRPMVEQMLAGGAPGGLKFDFQNQLGKVLPDKLGAFQADSERMDAVQKRMMRQMRELEQRMEQMQREFQQSLPGAPPQKPAADPTKA